MMNTNKARAKTVRSINSLKSQNNPASKNPVLKTDENSRSWYNVLVNSAENRPVDKNQSSSLFHIPKPSNSKTGSVDLKCVLSSLHEKITDADSKDLAMLLVEINNVVEKVKEKIQKKNSDNFKTKSRKYNGSNTAASSNKQSETCIRNEDCGRKDAMGFQNDTESYREIAKLITSLKEENKIINDLKETQLDSERKLSAYAAENKILKQKLSSTEAELKKANRALKIKNSQIAFLKTQISNVIRDIRRQIQENGHRARSPSLDRLNESVASVPSNDESFGSPIRPASSSPTSRNASHRQSDEDSGIQANAADGNRLQLPAGVRETIAKVQNEVKRTVDQLQSNDSIVQCCNLSDVTYISKYVKRD